MNDDDDDDDAKLSHYHHIPFTFSPGPRVNYSRRTLSHTHTPILLFLLLLSLSSGFFLLFSHRFCEPYSRPEGPGEPVCIISCDRQTCNLQLTTYNLHFPQLPFHSSTLPLSFYHPIFLRIKAKHHSLHVNHLIKRPFRTPIRLANPSIIFPSFC